MLQGYVCYSLRIKITKVRYSHVTSTKLILGYVYAYSFPNQDKVHAQHLYDDKTISYMFTLFESR